MSYHNRQAVVSPVVVPELAPRQVSSEPKPMDVLADVPGVVTVIAGRADMSMAQVQGLEVGDIVTLDRNPDATVDIYVNGTHIARGDVIVLDETIAARVTDLDRKPRRES